MSRFREVEYGLATEISLPALIALVSDKITNIFFAEGWYRVHAISLCYFSPPTVARAHFMRVRVWQPQTANPHLLKTGRLLVAYSIA